MKLKKDHSIENKELALRLAEAEDTLDAIRKGEVDSIVVSGYQGEQVYTISSPETPYRTFIEEMNEGAVTLTKDGVILYCNKRFGEFVCNPLESVMGSYIHEYIIPSDKLQLDELLNQKISDRNLSITITLVSKLHIKISAHVLPPYLGGDNCILIVTDITEIKKKETELLKLHVSLKKKHHQIRELRLDLINGKIDSEGAVDNLRNVNKKLREEIANMRSTATK